MNAIQIVDLTKQYKEVTAVDGLNLTVGEGELFSLLGVNGAGKTTTIKMLCCLTRPTSGEAFLCGESILQSPERVKEIIGVSPQETAVAANLTVRENLELMGGVHGFPKEKTAAKIQELSQQLKLGEVLSRRAGKLSGGWQRRLSIAMALIGEPKILFLDEPTLGLDVLARSDLWDTIRATERPDDHRSDHPLHGGGGRTFRPGGRDAGRPPVGAGNACGAESAGWKRKI